MQEQQNPSTPDLHQPLLFAPSELLACGLRDAHHHPLVGVRTEAGVRSWRTSPATAWEHPLVELGTHGHQLLLRQTRTSGCSALEEPRSQGSGRRRLPCA